MSLMRNVRSRRQIEERRLLEFTNLVLFLFIFLFSSFFSIFSYFALPARRSCPVSSTSSPPARFPGLFRFIPRTSNDVLVQWSVSCAFLPSVLLRLLYRHLVFPFLFLLPTLYSFLTFVLSFFSFRR